MCLFSVIIVDESHLAKKQTTLLNMTIRPLEYGVALLLTGTPVFNTCRDLAGQLMLLPGGRGAFENLDHLTELIRLGRPAWEGEEEMVHVDGPGGHRRLLLNNLLAALTISVYFSKHRYSQLKIDNWVRKAQIAINRSRRQGNKSGLGFGIALLRSAQVEAANPLLRCAKDIGMRTKVQPNNYAHPELEDCIMMAFME
ncbi:Ff.00g121210.m01.CDS01 [Fusarium sp. VM40]|nr:Ff.00g121210.m01.CDS01 [Fusarium sp. VM40]